MCVCACVCLHVYVCAWAHMSDCLYVYHAFAGSQRGQKRGSDILELSCLVWELRLESRSSSRANALNHWTAAPASSRWTWPHVWTHHSSTVYPDAFAISCVIQIGNDNWQVNACKGWGNTLPWSLWKTGQIHTQGDSSAMRRGMGKMLVEFWQNACFHIWQRQRGRPTGPVLLGSQALRDPHKGAITLLLHECWEKHMRHRDGT